VALALATFMQVLDSTVANVAVPTLAGNLGVSASEGTWVITSFAVALGVSVPLTGWIMGRYGVVPTFVASVLMFTIASLLCGLAWNIETLIAFRVLQGAVSGPMIPGSQTLMLMVFPRRQRSLALALWAGTTLIAPVCGPVLGGYISDNFSWSWIFLINVPVGLVCALICWHQLRDCKTPTRDVPIDAIGFALLIVWVGTLQVMLDTGKDADWFASARIEVEAAIAGVGFLAWLVWELTAKYPIVDLSLFRNRNFAVGTAVVALGYAVFFGNTLLLPLWLQTQIGYTATWAGLVAAPSGIIALMVTPFAARMTARVDARMLSTFALAAFGISFWMRAGYTPDADYGAFVRPLLVQGVGMGLFFTAILAVAYRDISGPGMPAASGLTHFARTIAASFAAAVTTTIWERREALHQTRLGEALATSPTGWNAAIEASHEKGLTLPESVATMTDMVVRQSYTMAAVDYFWLSSALILFLIPLLWFARRTIAGGSGDKASSLP
jgi:DHA2 family multidrug resistance protein